jgi:hypothetical protein
MFTFKLIPKIISIDFTNKKNSIWLWEFLEEKEVNFSEIIYAENYEGLKKNYYQLHQILNYYNLLKMIKNIYLEDNYFELEWTKRLLQNSTKTYFINMHFQDFVFYNRYLDSYKTKKFIKVDIYSLAPTPLIHPSFFTIEFNENQKYILIDDFYPTFINYGLGGNIGNTIVNKILFFCKKMNYKVEKIFITPSDESLGYWLKLGYVSTNLTKDLEIASLYKVL